MQYLIDTKERANCSVVALMQCLGICYCRAAQILEERMGRKHGRRLQRRNYNFESLGFVMYDRFRLFPFRAVLPFLRKGRFVICIRGHMFAVINGKTTDPHVKPGSIVWRIYEKKKEIIKPCGYH